MRFKPFSVKKNLNFSNFANFSDFFFFFAYLLSPLPLKLSFSIKKFEKKKYIFYANLQEKFQFWSTGAGKLETTDNLEILFFSGLSRISSSDSEQCCNENVFQIQNVTSKNT